MGEIERIQAEYARRAREIPEDFYSAAAPANLFRRQEHERVRLALLRSSGALPLAGRRILDVGCGTGQQLVDLETLGADRGDLAGIDLLPERVHAAGARLGGADIRLGDAQGLPWADGSFDVVCQSTVFSSILERPMRRAVAGEMRRVLAPGGVILWYDFFVDNPRNRAVRGVRRREVGELFAGMRMTARRTTLLPPLARRVVPVSWTAATLLQQARVLNTHLLIALS